MTRCEACDTDYESRIAAELCAADDERRPRKKDWLDPTDWG